MTNEQHLTTPINIELSPEVQQELQKIAEELYQKDHSTSNANKDGVEGQQLKKIKDKNAGKTEKRKRSHNKQVKAPYKVEVIRNHKRRVVKSLLRWYIRNCQ